MFSLMARHARRHPSLLPLFLFIGSGAVGAGLYLLRLAVFSPDVCWDKKNNPEPWNKLGPTDQYKGALGQNSEVVVLG
ncbi:PREDICTED: cytochrome c oxidase subunit NDUFA4 isoform X2 [Crocodylus porosus]|uniref:cytochrome c oxidase subunit NDUFA4 isoform X2 n=1 Tax=Crocodylus porosus TaxID=8502 RepID=UPI00093F3A34|nr:PREDICTED: cytochrome c oxidase subunit NDUFA4 isoform X2 [Crocodylus porosus]